MRLKYYDRNSMVRKDYIQGPESKGSTQALLLKREIVFTAPPVQDVWQDFSSADGSGGRIQIYTPLPRHCPHGMAGSGVHPCSRHIFLG